MEKNDWIISETMEYSATATATQPSAPTMGRLTKRRAMKAVGAAAPARPRAQQRTNKKHMTALSWIAVAGVIAFALIIGMLFQLSVISELNGEIRTAQTELSEKQSLNDSKNGQLVSSQETDNIEATARSYGMTEPTSDQYIYETIDNSAAAN